MPSKKASSVEVIELTSILPPDPDTSALEAVKSAVVIVETAPAILAIRLVSTAAALEETVLMFALSLVNVTKSLDAAVVELAVILACRACPR